MTKATEESNIPVKAPEEKLAKFEPAEVQEMKNDMANTDLGEVAKSRMLDIGYNHAYISYQTKFLTDLYKGGALPKGLDTVGKALMAAQAGYERGMSVIQSLNSFAFINGKLTFYGSEAIALVMKAGHIIKWGICNDEEATITIIRGDNESEITEQVTLRGLQAKNFKNLQNDNWKVWPGTMLKYRAFWNAAKFIVPDALNGVSIREVQEDEVIEGTVVNDQPQSKHSSLEEELEKPEPKKEPKKIIKKGRAKVQKEPEPVEEPIVEEIEQNPAEEETEQEKYDRLVEEEIKGTKLTVIEKMFMGKFEGQNNFK
jgi:hypothetical protein